MKKAFFIATLSVWTLGLLVGLGLVVVSQVTATNTCAADNFHLRTENAALIRHRDKLIWELKVLRTTTMGQLQIENAALIKHRDRLLEELSTYVGGPEPKRIE